MLHETSNNPELLRLLAEEHHARLLAEANRARLIRQAKPTRQPAARSHRALAAIGRLLVAAGKRLEARHTPTAARCAHSCDVLPSAG